MKNIILILMLCNMCLITAQNPFEQFDYQPKVSTLGQGKYEEFFDNDSIVQIGSVLFNAYTNSISSFEIKEIRYSEATLKATVMSRWMSSDPLAEDPMQIDLTPYNYSWNNPVNINDPDGKCPSCLWGALIGAAVEYGSQVATNLIKGQELGEALINVDPGKLAVATATGALTGGLSALKVVGATAKVYKATAITATVAAGNMVEQKMEGKKTVDAAELGLEIATDKLPIPKIKAPQLGEVTENTIKTLEKKLDRAQRVAGDNPRPSRAEAVKEAKKEVSKQKVKQKTLTAANQVGQQIPEGFDSTIKEVVKETIKMNTIDKKN